MCRRGEARRGEARRAVRVCSQFHLLCKRKSSTGANLENNVVIKTLPSLLWCPCSVTLVQKRTNQFYCCHEWPTHLIPLSRGLYFSLGWKVNKPCPFRGAKFVLSLWLHVKTVWFTRFSHEYSALIGLFYRKYIVIGPTPSTPSVLHDLHCWPKFNQHKTITKIPSLSIVLRVFTRII